MSAPSPRPLLQTLDRVGSRVLEDRLHERQVLPLKGSPSRPLPEHIRRVVADGLDLPDPRLSRGLPELREAIAIALEEETGVSVDPERDVLVTNGAMQALNVVCRAFLSPGERVLVPSPNFYLEGVVRLAGGEPVYLPCREEDGWRWDLERIEAAMPGIRIFFACNPTNPTGFLPSQADLRAVLDLASRHGALVLCDESYDRFVYDGAHLTSILSFRAEHAVLVRSLSKRHALTSWRVGYMVASPAVIDACTTVLEWEVLHCAALSQRVAAAALTGPQGWLGDLAAEYQANRDAAYDAIQDSGWLSCRKPAAGPFLFCSTRNVPGAADRLLGAGIPVVDGCHFRAPGYVRLPFGGDEETIRELCRRLRAMRREL